MKRKVIYSDVPRPYDKDAARLLKVSGFIFSACLLLVVILAVLTN
jgi:hypothetical protein